MGKTTTLAERIRIVELAETGLSDPQIAARLGIAAVTARKWRRRGTRLGREALASRMGRPRRGALSTARPAIPEAVRQWRMAHPGWGSKTLRAELARDPRFAGRSLPSRATLARFLKEEGLSRHYARHTALPAPPPQRPLAPHEQWEMDAYGQVKVPDVGWVALINLNDRCSRLRVLSYPCWLGATRLERKPRTPDYQVALRLAFRRSGLPDRLVVDRDSIFYDHDSPSPFPTRWHLWLIALGVEVEFARAHCPTDKAITERSHQLWASQVLEGATFASWEALYQALDARREFLNDHLPCASLGEQPPRVAYPEASVPRREYRPEWEPSLLQEERIYAYLARGRWFRKVSSVGVVSLGGYSYGVGQPWKEHEVEITFDAQDAQLVFRSAGGEEMRRLPLRGVSATELMGDGGPLGRLPNYQLSLPFTWDDWQRVRLCATFAVRHYAT